MVTQSVHSGLQAAALPWKDPPEGQPPAAPALVWTTRRRHDFGGLFAVPSKELTWPQSPDRGRY